MQRAIVSPAMHVWTALTAIRRAGTAAMTGRSPAPWWPLLLLGALIVLGLVVPVLDLADWRAALAQLRSHAGQWWVAPALAPLQVLLFTVGLPGSALLWLVAPLYAPIAATARLTGGGRAGALAAYGFAHAFSGASLARLQARHGYRILQRDRDVLLLCALRLAPGLPHSVLDCAAGVQRLPLSSLWPLRGWVSRPRPIWTAA